MSKSMVELDIRNENYYKLKTKPITWKQILLYPFKLVWNVAVGLPSYLLGRVLALIIFNPLFSINPEQDNFQYLQSQRYPDDLHSEDFAVLNVTDKPSIFVRIVRNYARKMLTYFPNMPDFLVDFISRQLFRVNSVDAKKCEEVIGRLGVQITGISLDNQPVTPLVAEGLFLKGTEFINPELREKLFSNINSLVQKGKDAGEKFDIRDNQKKIRFYTLETQDGAVLDSAEIAAPGEADKPYQDRTFVITCMPRSNNFTAWIKQHRIFANEIGTTYISFNYRGVERSRGLIWDQNDMVKDAVSQAERLLALGVKPENIAFQGECLGAAIATMAAAKMHKDGFKVELFNCRSFRSTGKLVLYKILPGKHDSKLNPINWFRYAAGGLFMVIGMPLLWLCHWDMNAEKAYDSIPTEYKGFLNAAKDPLVDSAHASMYAHFKERYVELSEKVKRNDATPLEVFELQQMGDVKAHKFHLSEQDSGGKRVNRHTCPLQSLVNHPQDDSHELDARAYQIKFFREVFHKPDTMSSSYVPEL